VESFEPIVTARLVLQPIARSTAEAVLAGDFAGIRTGQGWPHADTVDGLRMAVLGGHPAGWFVTLNGIVIGDCGVPGPADDRGDIEVGYGLAAPHRGHGYGTELVAALSQWLLAQTDVQRVVARGVLTANTPSRTVLERAGFTIERADEHQVDYALTPPAE
jgi:RimJ/RimL family protein N-acetyltransferase